MKNSEDKFFARLLYWMLRAGLLLGCVATLAMAAAMLIGAFRLIDWLI